MQANTAAAIDSKLDGAATQSGQFTPTAAVVVPDSRRERPDRKRTMPHALSPELAQRWLAWQCRMVATGLSAATSISRGRETPGELIANWPGEGEGHGTAAAGCSHGTQSRPGSKVLSKSAVWPRRPTQV